VSETEQAKEIIPKVLTNLKWASISVFVIFVTGKFFHKVCNTDLYCLRISYFGRKNVDKTEEKSAQHLQMRCLISKNLKIKICKAVILPVVLYECETWYLT